MEAVIAGIVVVGGVIIWGIRLEGRVNTAEAIQESQYNSLKELINSRFDDVEKRIESVDRRVNGHGRH